MSLKPTAFGVVAGSPVAPPPAAVPPEPNGGFKPTAFPAAPSPAAGAVPAPGHTPTAVGVGAPRPTPAVPSGFVPTGVPAQPASKRDFGLSAIPGVKRVATVLVSRVATGLESAKDAVQSGAQQLAKAASPSALPGIQRRGLDVSLEELRAKFPNASEPEIDRARGVLAGVMLASTGSATWLEFGQTVQEELAALVRERLDTVQQPTSRVAAQHLARLHALLSDVLEAFEGGLFRKSPDAVWNSCKAEVQALEQLLRTANADLGLQIKALEKQKRKVASLALQLGATALAADYLAGTRADAAGLLVARLASLTGSQVLLREHATHLDHDILTVQELTTLVQAGVMVKLPAVYTQLAALTGKPNDTQRFLAAEKLTDVLHVIIPRK